MLLSLYIFHTSQLIDSYYTFPQKDICIDAKYIGAFAKVLFYFPLHMLEIRR